MRELYHLILCLHPYEFRLEYGDELLWIFEEETLHGRSSAALFVDALVSLTRQWFIRRGAWKWALGFVCALIQVAGLLMDFRIRIVP